jgi:hypothetical protein
VPGLGQAGEGRGGVSGRKSRLQRKAARVVKSALEREFDELLGAAKRTRDKALHDAGERYRKGLEKLVEERAAARVEAYKEYDEQRAAIVKAMARKEAEAA